VGTDGRSFLAALETSRATSEFYPGRYQGWWCGARRPWPLCPERLWPVEFLAVPDNSVEAYPGPHAAFREGA